MEFMVGLTGQPIAAVSVCEGVIIHCIQNKQLKVLITNTPLLLTPMYIVYLYNLQKEICINSYEMKIIFIPHLMNVT